MKGKITLLSKLAEMNLTEKQIESLEIFVDQMLSKVCSQLEKVEIPAHIKETVLNVQKLENLRSDEIEENYDHAPVLDFSVPRMV